MNLYIEDNFLDDPDSIIEWATTAKYYDCKEHPYDSKINSVFPGMRSLPLNDIDSNLYGYMLYKLIPIYRKFNFDYKQGLYSYAFSKLKTDTPVQYHNDISTSHKQSNSSMLAGLIYLNKEPPDAQETGTWLIIDNKIKKIPNAFNRLIMYDGALEHSPGVTWGETWDDCRLVITIFNTFSNEFKLDS
jgi:hypothetical protein